MYPKIEQLVVDQLKLLLDNVTADVANYISDTDRFREFGIIDLALPRRSGKTVAACNLSRRLRAPVIYPSYYLMNALDTQGCIYAGNTVEVFLNGQVAKVYPYSHVIADELSQAQLDRLIDYLLFCISKRKIDPNVKLISLRTPCV